MQKEGTGSRIKMYLNTGHPHVGIYVVALDLCMQKAEWLNGPNLWIFKQPEAAPHLVQELMVSQCSTMEITSDKTAAKARRPWPP